MIKVLGGQKNPYQAWSDIFKADPDVLQKTEDFVFPGRGQKASPVARTKEDAYYILGLLPLLLHAARLDPLRRKPFQHFGVFCRPA